MSSVWLLAKNGCRGRPDHPFVSGERKLETTSKPSLQTKLQGGWGGTEARGTPAMLNTKRLAVC